MLKHKYYQVISPYLKDMFLIFFFFFSFVYVFNIFKNIVFARYLKWERVAYSLV